MKQPNVLDDNLGIAISWLCICQCLAEPVARVFFASLTLGLSEATHVILACWVVLFAFAAVAPESLKHCNSEIRVFVATGLTLVVVSTMGRLMGMPETLEVLLSIVGNAILICAHRQNKKLIHAHNSLISAAQDHKVTAHRKRYCV
ncbi:MAG: MerC domain-containing protein [Candidatus Obscuribacterales bacterium]|nr:MerC domain-containing protein [Candidatus Obscuribacterales bacterium]